MLVDAGSPGHEKRILRRVHGLGRGDLRLIYVTHAHLDHYGSAAALRRLTGAPIAIHRADAEAMARGETPIALARGRGKLGRLLLPLAERYLRPEPVQADVLLDDGDELDPYGLDAVVVHTPGHTPGSSCLYLEGRVAFVGDLISTVLGAHAQRTYACDWAALAESLRRVQALAPALVYGGHGGRPISGATFQRLKGPS